MRLERNERRKQTQPNVNSTTEALIRRTKASAWAIGRVETTGERFDFMKKIETVEEWNKRWEELKDAKVITDYHRAIAETLQFSSGMFYFDFNGDAVALRSDLIRKPTGEEIVNAVVLADALSGANPLPDGKTQFIWSSNANEQIEAALEEIMSK